MNNITLFTIIGIIGLYSLSFSIAYGQTTVSCINGIVLHVIEIHKIFQCYEDRITVLENNPAGADQTTASNIGTSGVGVFSSEVGNDLQFKKLISSNNVTLGITSNGTNVIFVPSAGSESTVCNNLGTSGIIVCTGGNVNLRRFISANNATLSIQANSTNVILNNLAPEATTGSNLGTSGQNIFSSEVGNDLQFKRLHTIDSCLLLTNNSTNVNADTLEQCEEKLIEQITGQTYLSVPKTNIGTTYVDIYTATFDEENLMRINFSNATYIRIQYIWDYVGVGGHQVRWVDMNNNTNVLFESGAFFADCDSCDSGYFVKPSWVGTGVTFIEWQGKSLTGTDDPVAKGYKIMVK